MAEPMPLLESTWNSLFQAMQGVFELKPMSAKDVIALFNLVVDYFRSPEYQNVLIKQSKVPLPADKLPKDVDVEDLNLPGGYLYFRVRKFFREKLEKFIEDGKDREGESFLRFYAELWEKYQFVSKVIASVLSSMKSNWIVRQREQGYRDITNIFTLAMKTWKEKFFERSNQSLTRTCFDLIRRERSGESIETSLIKQVIQSYVFIGVAEAEQNGQHQLADTLKIYKNHFEKEFLEDTEKFYATELVERLSTISTMDYTRAVVKYIEKETRRLELYLHESTGTPLFQLINRVLIENQLERMYKEAERLIPEENITDLALLFRVISRIPAADKPIQSLFQTYAHKFCVDSMFTIADTACNDPKVYIEQIIELYKRFDEFVKEAFQAAPSFRAALDMAFVQFVNKNEVTIRAGNSKKSSEFLAKYCDLILRKGERAIAGGDIEEKFNEILTVFNHIEDKDVFQTFYGKLLGKRLIHQLSASDESEESMINRLKNTCGYDYSSKLERMLKDIRSSRELSDLYNNSDRSQKSRIELSVKVLSANSWPFSSSPSYIMPTQIGTLLDDFSEFHNSRHHGRKLEWLHQLSRCELRMLYADKQYMLQLTPVQAILLLLFNDKSKLNIEEIHIRTNIDQATISSTIDHLRESQILKSPAADAKKEANGEDAPIELNQKFKSNRIRINLVQLTKVAEQKETEAVNQTIEDDRKYAIQAAIVRVMKSRNQLTHVELMGEVITQLARHFRPQIPSIKSCIDLLIEKEYLERDSNKRDIYRYKA